MSNSLKLFTVQDDDMCFSSAKEKCLTIFFWSNHKPRKASHCAAVKLPFTIDRYSAVLVACDYMMLKLLSNLPEERSSS